jgi:hypothetical protein
MEAGGFAIGRCGAAAKSLNCEPGGQMLRGLYKIEVHTAQGSRRGVLYAYDGRVMGGNSAFAFTGTYLQMGDDEVSIALSTFRYSDDPNYQPLFNADKTDLAFRGTRQGERYCLEGDTGQVPNRLFTSVITPIKEEDAPPKRLPAEGGIRNGLYSIRIRMLDGIDGGNTGVMLLHDGAIHGGDGYFGYIGSYRSADGKWKGELVNHEHTPTHGERPIFGGYEVGIGFSGSYTDRGAVAEATALVGKRSIRFSATMQKLVEV